MNRLKITSTAIAGVKIVTRQQMGDQRGFLSRIFCRETLMECGWQEPVAQINHSLTSLSGTVRGLHFQYPPHAERKLISCIRGEVWDVAVDLRPNSPTFLCHVSHILSSENLCAMLLPPGVAHGFQALKNDSELLYCHSAPYVSDAEGGLRPTDPKLNIPWPLPVKGLSLRDKSHPLLDSNFTGVSLS